MTRIEDDPVGWVLDALWADMTRDGVPCTLEDIRTCVAGKEYERALVLAIAVECDKARREAVEEQICGRPLWLTRTLRMEALALAARQCGQFVAEGNGTPTPPRSPMVMEDLERMSCPPRPTPLGDGTSTTSRP